jgi:uncharacterized membrane protein
MRVRNVKASRHFRNLDAATFEVRQLRDEPPNSSRFGGTMHRRSLAAFAIALLMPGCRDSAAPTQAIQDLAALGSTEGPLWVADTFAAGTVVVDMNETGQVVGRIGESGFLWQDGVFTPLDFIPVKINDRGQVLGALPGACCFEPSFVLWEAGITQPLAIDGNTVGATSWRVSGLSNEGDIVGTADVGGPRNGWKWRHGTLSMLPPLQGRDEANTAGLNNRGWVVGESTGRASVSRLRATIWRDSMPEALPLLDSTDNVSAAGLIGTNAAGPAHINARGDIPGWSGLFEQDPNGIPGACCIIRRRAVVWRDGSVRELGAFPGMNSAAHVVNERGQVAGAASFPTGSRAFIWTEGVVAEQEPTPTNGGSVVLVRLTERGELLGRHSFGNGDRRAVVWVHGRAHDLGHGNPIAMTNSGDVLVQEFRPMQPSQPTHGVLFRRVQ